MDVQDEEVIIDGEFDMDYKDEEADDDYQEDYGENDPILLSSRRMNAERQQSAIPKQLDSDEKKKK